jgi:hypothetical protein
MTMKTTITKSAFIDAFRAMDRFDQFGHEALGLLFDYFEQLEADIGEEMELDVIAICCEYAVDTVEDIANAYGVAPDEVMDYLYDYSTVVGECSDGRIVYVSVF